MKKVLITGGAGFIAHHLVEFLIKNTNWSPDYDLESGLLETINWFKNSQIDYKTDLYHV